MKKTPSTWSQRIVCVAGSTPSAETSPADRVRISVSKRTSDLLYTLASNPEDWEEAEAAYESVYLPPSRLFATHAPASRSVRALEEVVKAGMATKDESRLIRKLCLLLES